MGNKASSVSSTDGDPMVHVIKTMTDLYSTLLHDPRESFVNPEDFERLRAAGIARLNQALALLEEHHATLTKTQQLLALDAPNGSADSLPALAITPARIKSVARPREEKELLADAINNNAMPKSRSRVQPQIVVAGTLRTPAAKPAAPTAKPASPAAKAAAKQPPTRVRSKPANRSAAPRKRTASSGSRSRKRPAVEESDGDDSSDSSDDAPVVEPSKGEVEEDGQEEAHKKEEAEEEEEEEVLIEEGQVQKQPSRTRSRSPKGLTPGAPVPSPRSKSRARKTVHEVDEEAAAPSPAKADVEADPLEEDVEDASLPPLKPIVMAPATCTFCKKENPSAAACLEPGCGNYFCAACADSLASLKCELKCAAHK